MFKRFVLILAILFSILTFLSVSYWIYLSIPYTYEEFKSPYGNATIKVVLDNKLPFFSFNAGPVDGRFIILYRGIIIDRLTRSECCYTNYIEDIKWYKDSVRFKYIDGGDSQKIVYDKFYKFH